MSKAKMYLKLDGEHKTFDPELFRQTLGHDLEIDPSLIDIPFVADSPLVLEILLPESAAERLYQKIHSSNGFGHAEMRGEWRSTGIEEPGQAYMSDMTAPEVNAEEALATPPEGVAEAAAEMITAEATEAPAAEVVEAAAEVATEAPVAEVVEAAAEVVTEAPVAEVVEAAAEVATEAPVAEVVEAAAEVATEAPVAEVVEAAAEVATEAPAAEVVEAVAEPVEPPLAIEQRSMSDLVIGMALGAVVKRITLYGAFCDIGIGKDGLLHISQLGLPDVRNVEDVLQAGQALTVYVMRIDAEQGRIALSLVKPVGAPWDQLRVGGQVTGKIIKMETYGVFLEFGAERPGMIHVSELANGYVKSPEDVVQMGDTLTAQIIKIDRKKKRIDLSVKALSEQEERQAARAMREEQQEEAVPTAMELALRLAMKQDDDDFGKRGAKKGRKEDRRDRRRDRDDYEGIFDRTIRGHRG